MTELTFHALVELANRKGIKWESGTLSGSEKLFYSLLLLLAAPALACSFYTPEHLKTTPVANDDDNGSPDAALHPTFTATPSVGGMEIATPGAGALYPVNIGLEGGTGITEGVGKIAPIADLTQTIASFENSTVYWYPNTSTLRSEIGDESGFTIIGGLNVVDEGGKIVGELGIVTSGVDESPLLAEKFVDNKTGTVSWVVLTSELEKVDPSNPDNPESDGLAEVVGWELPAAPFGLFLSDGSPSIRLVAELGEDGVPTGRLMYSINDRDSGQKLLTIEPSQDDGLEVKEGVAKNAAPALIPTKLVDGLQNTLDQLSEWGVPTEGLNYTYHTDVEGELGIDLGSGTFLTVDGNVLIYVGGTSFDEIDPKLVKFGDAGRIQSIDGYELQDGIWVESITFEPMELTTDPNNMGVCEFEGDIDSGRLDWSIDRAVENGEIVFPEDAFNGGWGNKPGENIHGSMFLSSDSKDAQQIVSLCKINDAFLGLPDKTSYVASVVVLNVDGTHGNLHFFLNDEKELKFFLTTFGQNKGIRKEQVAEIVEQYWHLPAARLYRTQGDKLMFKLLDQLQSTGVVPKELEKLLVSPATK